MGFDRLFKRWFPLVIMTMIGGAAYFQAGGVGRLLGASIGQGPHVQRTALASSLSLRSARKSGTAILERNPFDSETGPLVGHDKPQPTGPSSSPEEPLAENTGDPLLDPECDFGRVMLISTHDDPAWSFAAIQDKGGSTLLRRRGDELGGHKVRHLAWNRVWLENGPARCQMKLGSGDKVSSSPARAPRKKKKKRRRNSRKISSKMAAKIHKVSDTDYNIERSLLDEVLENSSQLMRSARIVPEREGGKTLGIRLFGIRKGTLLGSIGMKNGDRLESINGFAMGDPQKALEAYGRLRTASKLTVQVNRKGKPVTLNFNIQ
jgi:general secretion pathway protein C